MPRCKHVLHVIAKNVALLLTCLLCKQAGVGLTEAAEAETKTEEHACFPLTQSRT